MDIQNEINKNIIMKLLICSMKIIADNGRSQIGIRKVLKMYTFAYHKIHK